MPGGSPRRIPVRRPWNRRRLRQSGRALPIQSEACFAPRLPTAKPFIQTEHSLPAMLSRTLSKGRQAIGYGPSCSPLSVWPSTARSGTLMLATIAFSGIDPESSERPRAGKTRPVPAFAQDRWVGRAAEDRLRAKSELRLAGAIKRLDCAGSSRDCRDRLSNVASKHFIDGGPAFHAAQPRWPANWPTIVPRGTVRPHGVLGLCAACLR